MTDPISLLALYERPQLDGATAPGLEPANLDGLDFVRIRGIAAHWRPPENERVGGSAAEIATGAHAFGGWLGFVAIGSGDEIEVQFAAGGRVGASRLLKANYPGIQIQSGNPALGTELAHRFAFGGRLTGIPARSNSKPNTEQPGVEPASLTRVVRGMRGASWAFIVRAWPVGTEELLAQRADLVQKLSALGPLARQSVQRTVQETRSRTEHESHAVSDVFGGTVVNRDAEYVVETLERCVERVDEALSTGAWRVAVHYASTDSPGAGQLGGLLRSVFSGPDSRPERIRLLPVAAAKGRARIADADCYTQLSSAELGLLIDLPRHESQGFRIADYVVFDVDAPAAGGGPTATIGDIVCDDTRTAAPMVVSLQDLSKHALVVGVTGSGKTTSVSNLLHQAWTAKVPFLVAEPAKTEYRALLASSRTGAPALVPSLRVYTVGNDRVAPFRLNPFEFDTLDAPSPSLLLSHIDTLKAVFNAAFVLYAPMPYVLEIALHEIYQDKGWNLATGLNVRLDAADWARRAELPVFPTLADLRRKVGAVTRRMGYDSRIEQDVSAGLQARIDSLRVGSKGLMLDVPRGLTTTELLEAPTILELESIGTDNEKAFVMGLVFTRICEHRRLQAANGFTSNTTQHLLVIEEAHRLLRNTSTDVDTESSNLRAQAVETLVNMLSEVRRYGQGVILAEQVPSKLATDAVKNTNLKLMHRVVAADDREILAGSANMSGEQSRRLGTLTPGEAVVFVEGADHPYLVATPDILAGRRDMAPSDALLASHSRTYVRLDRFLTVPDYATFGVPAIHFGAPDPVLLQPVLAFASSEAFGSSWARIVLRTVHARDKVAAALSSMQRALANASPYLPAGMVTNAMRLAVASGAAQAMQDRASERGWSYSTADRLRQSLTHGLILMIEDGASGRATAVLDAFARSYEAATRQEFGPFPGCVHCPCTCLYRSDVRHLIVPTLRTGMGRTLTDPTIKSSLARYSAAADLSLDAIARSLETEIRRPNSAAFCAALMTAAAAGLDEYQQDDFAKQIAPHLL